MKLKKMLVLAVVALCSLPVVHAQQQMPPLPVDTAVRTGKLANGLTYYVRHNNYPEHHVNFYIAQRVGSIQEEESQRGLAHFLEHMAFNGTENFKGNGVIDYTRSLGVEFGNDLNAYTSVDQTVYNINDVPSARVSALDSCLLILKDWSNGLLLEGDEIDKERGVIHEEWRLRSSAQQRMLERNLEKLYPGSKYGKRMPIGLMSVVDNFKYKEIRDYYHKWYRPDNQAIIVVGDIDVDRTEAKIKELFGSIPAPKADAAQVVDEAVPDNDQAIIVVDKDKEQQYNIVQIMFKHDPFPENMKGDMSYLIMDYMKSMITHMLNERLNELVQDPESPMLQAGSRDGEYIYSKTKDAFTLSVLPKDGKLKEATTAVVKEALRVQKFGFTDTEYARARENLLSRYEERYNKRNQTPNDRFGRAYASNYLEKEPIMSIEDEYKLIKMIAPNIPVEAVNQLAAQLISTGDKNLVVLNYNQEKEGAVYPTEADLKSAIDAAQSAELTAYVDNVKNEPLMKQLPKKGSVKKVTENTKLGYKEYTLSNGAKVIAKKTDYKDNEILFRAESKGGYGQYGKADKVNWEMFDNVIEASGLGGFSNSELTKALAGKRVSMGMSLTANYERLNGSSTVKDLETMFQLAYLYFTDITKDQKNVDNVIGQVETLFKNRSARPEYAFQDSLSYVRGNRNWREYPFQVDELKNFSYDRVLAMAKERLANAADFTFYVVGDFNEDTLVTMLEQYIAPLPASKQRENFVKGVSQYPAGKLTSNFTRASETPKAIAFMSWSTKALPYSSENRIKLSMAGQVLDKLCLQKIREDEGAAYSTSAGGNVSVFGDEFVNSELLVYCPMKPEKSDVALKVMREEINNVANGVDAATLKDIKELMVKEATTQAKENSYWCNVLAMWVSRGIDIQTDNVKTIEAQTPESVSALVKEVLKSGDHIEVIMLPEAAK